MVSTATTVTPSSTPSTNTTIIGAGVAPSPAPGSTHYITQPGQTQTYHIFLPTSQPGQPVTPYFPTGGLLQAATAAMPGAAYHVAAAPTNPYFTNFINPMIPANSEFFQTNVKSSNRGGHNNYKGRGRGGRGGGNNDRNTPGSNSSQASYNSGYQGYNAGGGQGQFSGYGGSGYNKSNQTGNRSNHSNWETSSQHSNSSQKKFSSSSGSSVHESVPLTNNTVQSPPGGGGVPGGPRMQVHHAHTAPHMGSYQSSQHHQYQPRHQTPAQPAAVTAGQKPENNEYGGISYHYQHTATALPAKEFVSNKRGRGRGGSSRGRDDMSGGYNSVPRGGGHPAGNGGPPQRNQIYHQPRHNSGGVPGQVAGAQEQPQQPRPEPPKPAPFNMKANDFPSLPGVQDPAPAADNPRFLDIVKGTAKMKLDDDQETLPDDFLQDQDVEDAGVRSVTDPASESASVSPRPRSKNSSVSETPVVSVERSGVMSPTEPAGVLEDGLISPPLVNGDAVKNDRDSGSTSPRQQSMVSRR